MTQMTSFYVYRYIILSYTCTRTVYSAIHWFPSHHTTSSQMCELCNGRSAPPEIVHEKIMTILIIKYIDMSPNTSSVKKSRFSTFSALATAHGAGSLARKDTLAGPEGPVSFKQAITP